MRRPILALVLAAGLVLVFAGRQGAQAEALSVATYCELSIARLQLAQATWEQLGRSPTGDEEDALWQRYGTTEEAYYAFASAHREEVEGYLAAHPEVQAQIERLSERLHELIEQAEGR